jgi:cytochrome P450
MARNFSLHPVKHPIARSQRPRVPPGPKGNLLLGSALDIRRDVLGFFTGLHEQYGEFAYYRLAHWPVYLVSDPEAIAEVLIRNHQNFIKNRLFWRQVTAIFGRGLVTSEGELWQRQRRLAAPAFNSKRLDAYAPTFVRLTREMMATWRPGEVREIHGEMMSLTLRIAAKTLFDTEVQQDVETMDHAVNALAQEITSRFARPIVIPDAVPLPGHIRYRRALRQIEQLVSRMIGERRSVAEDRGDLLSMLLFGRDETGTPMADRQVRDEVVTLLLAGHETTALALSWTWYLLGKHPTVAGQVADEVRSVLGSSDATPEDMARLPFTEQVITEAMRLYPPAYAIGREALRECELGGYDVRKGLTIYISPWVLHRDARFFDQPQDFRPERWSGDLHRQLPRFAYMPFGGGPRVCIGNRFAMMEAVLILATMVQQCELRGATETPVRPVPSITLRPGTGIHMSIAAVS